MATPKQTKISSFFASSVEKKRGKDKENCGDEKEEETQSKKRLKLGETEASASSGEGGVGGIATAGGEQNRKLANIGNASEAAQPAEEKRSKDADEATEEEGKTPSPPSPPLSPEVRAKMAQNKMAAKLKLLATKTSGLVTDFGPSWLSALQPEFDKDYFLKLAKFVAAERESKTVYPPASDVFSWTRACPLDQIKVVILGQDPYHGPNQAHGLCFSVQKGVPPPPSLVNMYKELETDIEGFVRPSHGYLGGWAEQGVLLLNACLTVRKGEANSHKDKGWETFTDAVIKNLSKTRPPGLVFILWGGYAQKKGNVIDRKRPGHHILTGPHPSPLSAHRGFFGCKHFSKTNDLLIKEGVTPIDWTKLPLP